MYPKLLAFTALIFSSSIAFAQQSDEDAIKQVITTSYIEGIQNRGSSESIRKGFHPSFHMLRFVDNDVKPLSIEEWITNIENSKAKNEPAQPRAV